MTTVRSLQASDTDAAVSFLSHYAESSMFLLSNLARVGIGNPAERFGGDYWAAVDDQGAIVGVLGHFWNGILLVQAPEKQSLATLIEHVGKCLERPVAGANGPDAQVMDILAGLNVDQAAFSLSRSERLFHLSERSLILPALGEPDVEVVSWGRVDAALLGEWLMAYNVEALCRVQDATLQQEIGDAVSDADQFERFVLKVAGMPVCLAGFNARLPDMVQVGPVWTPPEMRSRGYARYLVAKIVEEAFQRGVKKVILFTDSESAERAYRAVGFLPIGNYRLSIFKEPLVVS
jgi:GNAT superfamily N-acetyltransferase